MNATRLLPYRGPPMLDEVVAKARASFAADEREGVYSGALRRERTTRTSWSVRSADSTAAVGERSAWLP
jgi:hypothetical protein